MQPHPIIYSPETLPALLPSLQVSRVTIAAFPTTQATATGRAGLPAPKPALTNPWSVYLMLSTSGSIRVDPRPSPQTEEPQSVLQLKATFDEKATPKTSSLGDCGEVFAYDVYVREGLTAKDVFETIEKARFDRYRMHDSGQGCRYWIWCFLSFLKEVGFVVQTPAGDRINGARIRLQQVWLPGGILAPEEQQTHMVHGEFF